MSIVDDLRALDMNDPGRWPLLIRAVAVGLAFVAVLGAGIYMFVIQQEKPLLDRARQEEVELKATFEDRQRKAANFDSYRTQLAEIERDFGAMLRQLPGKTEVPSLLVDISQTAAGAGLEEKLFQPTGEIQKDFYAELPIKLRYSGSYHELGNFVSGIAALPRIVTLHDITIHKGDKDSSDDLTFDVTAKTYRYLDEEAAGGAGGAGAAAGSGSGGSGR
jgi:type IV pilus assembly protein PilO